MLQDYSIFLMFFTSLCGNFILQDIFKPAIMWLQDTGILIKLRDDELKAPNPIPRPKVKFNQPLSISQLATGFLLMTTGMLISISVFFAEFLNRPNYKAKGTKPHKVALGISTTGRNKNDKPVQESKGEEPKTESNEKRVQCPLCGKQVYQAIMRRHLHYCKKIPCQLCNIIITQNNMNRHVKVVHPESEAAKKLSALEDKRRRRAGSKQEPMEEGGDGMGESGARDADVEDKAGMREDNDRGGEEREGSNGR